MSDKIMATPLDRKIQHSKFLVGYSIFNTDFWFVKIEHSISNHAKDVI